VPDPLFLEAWFKAATRRMPTFSPPSLLLALQSLAAAELRDPAPATFMRALLPKLQVSRQARQPVLIQIAARTACCGE